MSAGLPDTPPVVAVDLDHAVGLAEAVWDGRPVHGMGVGTQMLTLAAAVLALAQAAAPPDQGMARDAPEGGR